MFEIEAHITCKLFKWPTSRKGYRHREWGKTTLAKTS